MMFLTVAELVELTGYRRPAEQMKALDRLGIAYVPPSGRRRHPLVRADVVGSTAQREPKWDALRV